MTIAPSEEMLAERDYTASVGRHCSFCDYQAICPQREEIVGRRLLEGWEHGTCLSTSSAVISVRAA